MDSILRTLVYGLTFYVRFVELRVLVRAPSPIEATVGKEALSLECSYRTTGSDIVVGVNWYRKSRYDGTSKLIAEIPNRDWLNLPPAFHDRYLASKGNMTTSKKGDFDFVKLQIKPAECNDEGTYECEVEVYGRQAPKKAKVQVHLNEEPLLLSLKHDPTILVENRPVIFTCTASIGRPAGTFRWLVYKSRSGSPPEEVEMSGVSTFSSTAGNCSPVGTSTLAIMISSADQKVKCIVQQQSREKFVQVSDEKLLDVKYRVKDTELYTRVGKTDLPVSRETVVRQGDNVNFVCRARGNPRPTFNWSYLPMTGHEGSEGLAFLLTRPELTVKNITANQSGAYVCVATNDINNLKYSETKSVRIVVKDRIPFGLDRPSSDKRSSYADERYLLIGGMVVGAMIFTLAVSLLSALCYRRCSRKSHVDEPIYTDVAA